MLSGEYCHRIRSNFVCNVSIGGDAISTHNNRVDQSLMHEGSGHVVGYDADVDVVFPKFPGGEPCSLQEWARFVRQHLETLAAFDRGANHAKRGSIARCRQRARVAVG